jgi:iron complex outermembrane receptor protein
MSFDRPTSHRPASPHPTRARALVVALNRAGFCGLLGLGALPLAALAQSAPADALEPVVITASPRAQRVVDAPYAIGVVGSEALRSAGPMVNLSEAMAQVPGIVVANRSNYAQDLQISSRGFGARANFGVRGLRMYTDGIPATMPDGQGQVGHFDLANAERIEVLRGPFSALYGNSSGGVIALYSAPIKDARVSLGVDAGTFGLHQERVSVQAPIGSGFAIAANASNFEIDGFRPHSDADRQLGNFRLEWAGAADKVTLALNGQHQRASDPLGLPYGADPGTVTPNALTYNTRKTIDQTQLGSSWTHRVGEGSALTSTRVTGYVGARSVFQMLSTPSSSQSAATNAGGVVDFDRGYAGLDLRADWALGDGDLVTGVNVERQRDDRRGYENFVGTKLGVVGNLRRDEINVATTREAYAQWQQPLGRAWQVTAGLRAGKITLSNEDHYVRTGNGDDSGTMDFGFVSPVLGLKWQPVADLTLHASASRGYESPTLGEVAYRSGNASGFNTDLSAQTSRQVELGVKWRSGGWGIDAAVFDIQTQNEIGVASSTGGRNVYRNVGETQRQGAEVATQWRATPTLRAQLALTVLHATYQTGSIAGNRIAGTQPASGFAAVAWQPWRGGEWGLEWRGQGRTAVNDANRDTVTAGGTGFAAGWSTLSLRYLHRFALTANDSLELLGRVDNLTNRQYAGSVIVADTNGRFYEPAPGRNALASLRYQHTF